MFTATSTALSTVHQNDQVRPGSRFVTIYPGPHYATKTPPASSIAPSTNEFELDADVKAKFLFCQVARK